MWQHLGPANGNLTLDVAEFVNLQGLLPDGSAPRSSIFETPERRIGTRGSTTDMALEVLIPACDLGELALRRWKNSTGPEHDRLIGGEILRSLAQSERSFWEIPTMLRNNQMLPSDDPVAEGFVAITKSADQPFEDARLSLVFYYNSKRELFAQAQIDAWLADLSSYLIRRGLAESLIAMVGEGCQLKELLSQGQRPLPLPRGTAGVERFDELIPESLRFNGTFHGRHPQIELDHLKLQVRVPISPDVEPEFSITLNQSKLVKDLMQSGFAVSWCDGIISEIPGTGGHEPLFLADLLPSPIDFTKASFGPPNTEHGLYYGPYLHIVAEHENTAQDKFDAASGTLLLLYMFKDYITGLEALS